MEEGKERVLDTCGIARHLVDLPVMENILIVQIILMLLVLVGLGTKEKRAARKAGWIFIGSSTLVFLACV